MKILGIIPARGGSKGILRKNIKLMDNKPLIQYTIEATQNCKLISDFIVNSEDLEIRSIATSLGAKTQDRPKEFWYDNSFQEVDRLLKWSVLEYEKNLGIVDIVVLLYPTAPLRTSNDISNCIDLIIKEEFDSSLSLREDRTYIWKKKGISNEVEPINYDPRKRGPNQLEGWNQWVENKAVYAMKRDLLIDTGCRLGGKIGYSEMSKLNSVDIDIIDDFVLAEHIIKLRKLSK
tara:strand:- start:826 stop:1524 length:699 start_codon:yes stop_codon:yes gene_type:complete